MKPADTVFVVPTYRLRDVADTIEAYDLELSWSVQTTTCVPTPL